MCMRIIDLWSELGYFVKQVELQYQHEYAGISTGIGLTANPIVNFSGVVGNNLLSLGTDLSFDTASGNFTKWNAGLNFTHTDLIASLILWVLLLMPKQKTKRDLFQLSGAYCMCISGRCAYCMCMFRLMCFFVWSTDIVDGYRNDKADTVTASYYHTVSPLTNTAVGAELSHSFSSNENSLTIGTQHALDPLTTVKGRVNNYGRASALIQHEWRPKSFFTISGEVDTRAIEKSAKIGLALALKP